MDYASEGSLRPNLQIIWSLWIMQIIGIRSFGDIIEDWIYLSDEKKIEDNPNYGIRA
uniref:Uncharacterized protein n=1 Tax=Rhizophagus irregularis (strain DAOM 181602 / DAOM 197198 / MUCL 43194) TaxID=747089 RepID=U9TXC8_RHIID